jgi:hypothetical protein
LANNKTIKKELKMDYGLYVGDIVDFGRETQCGIIRSIKRNLVTIQFVDHIVEADVTQIRRTGKCINKMPRTNWGWRRMCNRIIGVQ